MLSLTSQVLGKLVVSVALAFTKTVLIVEAWLPARCDGNVRHHCLQTPIAATISLQAATGPQRSCILCRKTVVLRFMLGAMALDTSQNLLAQNYKNVWNAPPKSFFVVRGSTSSPSRTTATSKNFFRVAHVQTF